MPWRKDANGKWGNFVDEEPPAEEPPTEPTTEQPTEQPTEQLTEPTEEPTLTQPETRKTLPQPVLPPRPDPLDDISFDGSYMTSMTTEEFYNTRTGQVEQKRVNGRANNHHYYNNGAGNPAAYNEEEEDSRSMSSMSMLFRKARGDRYVEPKQSSDYANYQFDDDATVDSLSDVFGKKQSYFEAIAKNKGDDALAGIIEDVADLHENGQNDQIDNIEPEAVVQSIDADNIADISNPHDGEEQPEIDAEKAVDVDLEARSMTNSTSGGSVSAVVDSTGSVSSSRRKRKEKRRRGTSTKLVCFFSFSFVALVVIAAVVFFYFYYEKNGNNSVKNGNIPTKDATRTPTVAPTPTMAPTVDYIGNLMEYLQDNQVYFEVDPLSPDYMAIQWLADEAQIRTGDDGISSAYGNGLELNKKLIQRFALLTLDFSLMRKEAPYATKLVRNKLAHNALKAQYTALELETYARSNTIAVKYLDECQWVGVTCASVGSLAGEVVEINFSHSGLTGTIPPEIKLLKNLKKLSLAGNEIRGSIPDSLYSIRGIEEVYMYQNQLTGTISPSIRNWWNMTRLHLSHNHLTGSIPHTFKSGDVDIRPIEYLNLYSNKLTGTIPDNLRFRRIKFADLGHNQFQGTLPDDIGEKWVDLRFLYLDHNDFTGTIPESYPTTGNTRMEAMTFNHNRLTGKVPGKFTNNKLLEFNVQDNLFTDIDTEVCKQSVFIRGEMVEFKADCDICECEPYCELKCGVETKAPKL